MRVWFGWRQFLLFVALVFFITHFLSVLELHQEPTDKVTYQKKTKKPDHLVFVPAAGEGLPNRLQCKGIKAVNKTRISASSNISNGGDGVTFVTVFTRNLHVENAEFRTSGNSFSCENGLVSCSTPDLTLSISSTNSSPEYFLTNSATSLKNTPRVDHPCLYTPGQSQIQTAGSENFKQSSGFSVHRSQTTLGRRLDYMFNLEWNPNVIKGYKSNSITPSSNVNMGTRC